MRGYSLIPFALAVAGLTSAGSAQTAEVRAVAETAPVGTTADDAADDPAIWRNPGNPAKSLIVATDKKAGLYVYGLDGRVRSFDPAGRLNNVDLIDLGRRGILVVASDRNDPAQARLRLYWLDPKSGKLTPHGLIDGGMGEAYGICLLRRGRDLFAFSVLKAGDIHQIRLDPSGNAPTVRIVLSLKLATQIEGCVADPRTMTLYVGEEDRGIWAFDARLDGKTDARLAAAIDGQHLVADVEGLALIGKGRSGGWLLASIQGDNAYALYRLPDMTPAGRFRIVTGSVGATEETDGIDLAGGSFGSRYPQGLLVVQDGVNGSAAQNFKLVSWRDILRALKAAPKH
jgi:3-phytase